MLWRISVCKVLRFYAPPQIPNDLLPQAAVQSVTIKTPKATQFCKHHVILLVQHKGTDLIHWADLTKGVMRHSQHTKIQYKFWLTTQWIWLFKSELVGSHFHDTKSKDNSLSPLTWLTIVLPWDEDMTDSNNIYYFKKMLVVMRTRIINIT